MVTGNNMIWKVITQYNIYIINQYGIKSLLFLNKGSESTNLVSVATTKIIVDVLERNNLPGGFTYITFTVNLIILTYISIYRIFNLIVGDYKIG
jgi:hypothetical protein